jgi:uncharacterized protein (DUF2236 family)
VTWRLHADPMTGLAGLRALLLQALHPVAAEGVGRSSSVRTDVWGRLSRTAEFLGMSTFGSTQDALAAGARVQGIARATIGGHPDTGDSFAIDETQLLAWVHACLVDSTLAVLGRSGVCLDEDGDRYVLEQVRSAALVGLDPADVPRCRGELSDYLSSMRPTLRLTAVAREELSDVLAPPLPARVAPLARPAWSAVAGLAFASLPIWARRLYSVPDPPGAAALHGAATTVALHAVRASLRGVQAVVPQLCQGPHERSAREQLAAPPAH